MSNRAVILAYSRYFLDSLQSRLTQAREARILGSDLAAYFIRVVSAGSVSV